MDIKSPTHIPAKSGVYLMKDIKNQVIYVGKAKNLKNRVRSYSSSDKSFKNRFLIPRVQQIDYILTDTESEAYLLEARLIKKHQPRYNIRLKDDKSYPYIRCSLKESFPRFYMERRVKKKGSLYFGPYTEAFFVRRMIRFLNEQFQIRDCSNTFMKSRKKPCLTYHIGHCTAPCVKKVDQKSYSAQIQKALSFLKGKNQKNLLTQLKKNIKKLAIQERFEEARHLRDRIQAIEFCSQKVLALKSSHINMDIGAFYGEKKSFLFQILHIREGAWTGQSSQYVPAESLIFAEKIKKSTNNKNTSPSKTTNKKNMLPKTDRTTRMSNSSNQEENMLPKELTISLLLQYYMDNVIPDLILLPPLAVCGEQELSKIKGSPVIVRTPKSRAEKGLAKMALQNAQSHFKEQDAKQVLLQKGLKEIQQKFGLKKLPFRMECFDVSHLQGQNQVASHVVFEKALPKKEDYRKYKIKHAHPGDDFGSLKEVLIRRFRHKEYKEPDLLLIDGGKGQLKKALEALKETGYSHIPVVSIAKKRNKADFSAPEVQVSLEKFYLPGRKNALTLSPHSPALKILCHLRDEAHRFALAYHRTRREKSSFLK